MDDDAIRKALVKQFDSPDLDISHEIYHEDAVPGFPQSGERFVGKANFLAWRKQYPAKVDYRIRRITGHGQLWVSELLISYDGSPWMFGISVDQFRGDRIAREIIYVTEGFAAAEWRKSWVTTFDPLASVRPADWDEGAPLGIEGETVASAR